MWEQCPHTYIFVGAIAPTAPPIPAPMRVYYVYVCMYVCMCMYVCIYVRK